MLPTSRPVAERWRRGQPDLLVDPVPGAGRHREREALPVERRVFEGADDDAYGVAEPLQEVGG